jgi:hypothetical protein
MKSAKKYDIGDLKRMTPEQRAALYENARRGLTEGGKEVIDLLDSSGLPLSAGGMTISDPTFLRMEEIVWSVAGRKAAIVATEEGLPALAGVEPLFTAEQLRTRADSTMSIIRICDREHVLLQADSRNAYFHRSCVTDRHRICMRWHRGSDYQ